MSVSALPRAQATRVVSRTPIERDDFRRAGAHQFRRAGVAEVSRDDADRVISGPPGSIGAHEAERRMALGIRRIVDQFVDGNALRSGGQTQRKRVDHKIGLLIERRDKRRRAPGIERIIRRLRVRLVDPDRLLQTVAAQDAVHRLRDVVHRIAGEIDVKGADVKVVIVGARGGIFPGFVDETLQVRHALVHHVVMPRQAGQMNLRRWDSLAWRPDRRPSPVDSNR